MKVYNTTLKFGLADGDKPTKDGCPYCGSKYVGKSKFHRDLFQFECGASIAIIDVDQGRTQECIAAAEMVEKIQAIPHFLDCDHKFEYQHFGQGMPNFLAPKICSICNHTETAVLLIENKIYKEALRIATAKVRMLSTKKEKDWEGEFLRVASNSLKL